MSRSAHAVSFTAWASMRLNGWLGYDPSETVCSRLHREERLLAIKLINAVCFVIYKEVDHCRKQAEFNGKNNQ